MERERRERENSSKKNSNFISEEDKSLDLTPIHLPQKRTCRSETGGYLYNDGDMWKTNPCQSCTCRNGQVHCFSQVCPTVTCSKSVLRKGSCCPTCLGNMLSCIMWMYRETKSHGNASFIAAYLLSNIIS